MKLFILILITCSNVYIFAQSLEWVTSNGSSYPDGGNSIATGELGDTYTTGYFQGTADFDPGTGVHNLTSNGDYDIYIQKLDPNGNFLWAYNIGGSGLDMGKSVQTDILDNVYVKGYFRDTVDFNTGSGTQNLTQSGLLLHVFLLKLDSDGNFLWAKNLGANGHNEENNTMAVSAIGDVYITGKYSGTFDFDPGPAVYNLTSNGGTDIYVLKIDLYGDFVWAKSIGGTSDDQGNAIAYHSNNIYVAGSYSNNVDFDLITGTTNIASTGGFDAFVLKILDSGAFDWVKSMGGSNSSDEPFSISIDNQGNIYTAGAFSGEADFDPNSGTALITATGMFDAFIQKLNPSGNLLWVKSFGGDQNTILNSIAVNGSGEVFSTGFFTGTVDFDPGSETASLSTASNYKNIFLQKLDGSGEFKWAIDLGNDNSNAEGKSLAGYYSESIHLTGFFVGTVDFNSGSNVENLSAVGNTDAFTLKIGACNIDNTITQTGLELSVAESNVSYQWIDCNNNSPINNATSQSFTATSNGSYACIIDNGNCSLKSDCKTISTVSINELNRNLSIEIYPNPSSDYLNINSSEEIKNITIYNSIGSRLMTAKNQRLININSLSNGYYTIEIETTSNVSTHKFIKYN